jgi:hypothetical protein
MEVRQLGDVPFRTESTWCLFADFGATELWCSDGLWRPDGCCGWTDRGLGTAWRSNGDANRKSCWDVNRWSRESQLQRLQSLEAPRQSKTSSSGIAYYRMMVSIDRNSGLKAKWKSSGLKPNGSLWAFSSPKGWHTLCRWW